jgi:hypothetical protein
VVANQGHGTVVEVPVVGLTHGPGLQLMHGVTGGIEVVVFGDLRQLSTMVTPVPLVVDGPGQEFAPRTSLACPIGRKVEFGGNHDVAPWVSLQCPALL